MSLKQTLINIYTDWKIWVVVGSGIAISAISGSWEGYVAGVLYTALFSGLIITTEGLVAVE